MTIRPRRLQDVLHTHQQQKHALSTTHNILVQECAADHHVSGTAALDGKQQTMLALTP
jgi:hypothetical protein